VAEQGRNWRAWNVGVIDGRAVLVLVGACAPSPACQATKAGHVLDGAVDGARQGYRTTRSELGGLIPPNAITAALQDFRAEGQRLSAALRAVELVERAPREK
jgi:hypothetical protein